MLLDQGFDDLETLADIEDADMRNLGLPEQHIAALRRALQAASGAGEVRLDDANPVVVFLGSVGLSQYAQALLQSGFDDMETLELIEDADMRDLGIPRGHALKLKKKLYEFLLHGGTQEEVQYQPHSVYPANASRAAPVMAAPAAAPRARAAGGGVAGARIAAAARAAATAPAVPVVSAARPTPTTQMKTTVEASWEQVQILGTYVVGESLYKHLFAMAPESMSLFPPEVRHKYRDWSAEDGGASEEDGDGGLWESPALRRLFGKVINAVGCTVAGLHDMTKLVPMLFKLGTRHISYGVSESYWPLLGQALDRTLAGILADSYTPEVRNAWNTVYGFMSSIMVEGLRAARAEMTSFETDSMSGMGTIRSDCSAGRPKSCAGSEAGESTRDAPSMGGA